MTATIPAPLTPGRRRLRLVLILALLLGALYQLTASLLEGRLRAAQASYHGPSLDVKQYVPAPPPLAAGSANAWDSVEATLLMLEGQMAVRKTRGLSAAPDPDLQKLVERLRATGGKSAALDEQDLAHIRRTLRRFEPALAILDEALRNAPEARYFTNSDVLPAEIEVPNLMGSLRIASLLRARAEVAIREGRAEDAWRDATGLYRLGYWNATAMNFLISGLVARAISHQGDFLVQELLSRAPADAASRESTLAEARRVEPSALFTKLFAAERAAMYSSLLDDRLEARNLPKPDGFVPTAWLTTWRPWLHYNAARYLEWADQADTLCAKVFYQQGDIQSQLKDLALPTWVTPASVLAFDCADASNKRDLWKSSLDQLEIAMALQTFRDQQGHYPATLDEAGSKLAARLDPFSGKPYRYLPAGNGYRLYSISSNGRDDDGRESRKPDGSVDLLAGDWVFEVAGDQIPEP